MTVWPIAEARQLVTFLARPRKVTERRPPLDSRPYSRDDPVRPDSTRRLRNSELIPPREHNKLAPNADDCTQGAARFLGEASNKPKCCSVRGTPLQSRSGWESPADVKTDYRAASFLRGNRVVFNIKGNDFRLVVAVHYNRGLIFVRFVGTHQQYDRINAEEI